MNKSVLVAVGLLAAGGLAVVLLVESTALDRSGAERGAGAVGTIADAAMQAPDAGDEPEDVSEPTRKPVAQLSDQTGETLEEQREIMFSHMTQALRLEPGQLQAVREIVTGSDWMGQGNPKVTEHPMSRTECQAIRAKIEQPRDYENLCGARNMVPLFDVAAGQKPDDTVVCVDQFEFPNVACEYPLVWVRASEAVALCEAVGKRICDAHEWEGACAGSLRPVETEYAFGNRRLQMEYLHNQERPITWAYGREKNHAVCATRSHKSPGCYAPTWQKCGSNTYPAGAFPQCVSSLGVYDLHGNAAEHMNLPLAADELASRGGYGQTEMKGSWFIFSSFEAHPDDCRWRARNWHGAGIQERNNHRNYHLGFRCCKDIDGENAEPDAQEK